MPFEYSVAHAFITGSIQAHAPVGPGVYGISNRREWLFIDYADNIQAQLLEHLRETGTDLRRRLPTGFNFERCDPRSGSLRRAKLVREYKPVCNRPAEQRSNT